MVKGLQIGLAEIGKIKLGELGAEKVSGKGNKYQVPVKLPYFLITTLERGANNNFVRDTEMMKEYDPEKGEPKALDIMFLYDDIDLNFPTRYARYTASGCKCSGDGEVAHELQNDGSVKEIPCNPMTCPFIKARTCKINGTLNCILSKTKILGGVYKFRTTSYHSVKQILNSLMFFQRATGGVLAGIPFRLTVTGKQVNPENQGKATVYVANVEYVGLTNNLLDTVIEMNKQLNFQRGTIKALELKAEQVKFANDPDADIIKEFYPEAQEGYEGEGKNVKVTLETAKTTIIPKADNGKEKTDGIEEAEIINDKPDPNSDTPFDKPDDGEVKMTAEDYHKLIYATYSTLQKEYSKDLYPNSFFTKFNQEKLGVDKVSGCVDIDKLKYAYDVIFKELENNRKAQDGAVNNEI